MVAISPLPVSPRQAADPVPDGIARDSGLRSSELAALLAKIESYGRLPADWAGPGSVVPATITIVGVRAFVIAIPPHLPLPQAAAAADGQIGLSWYPPSGSIHASFFDDGSLVYVVDVLDDPAGEEVRWSGSIPVRLLNVLNQDYGATVRT